MTFTSAHTIPLLLNKNSPIVADIRFTDVMWWYSLKWRERKMVEKKFRPDETKANTWAMIPCENRNTDSAGKLILHHRATSPSFFCCRTTLARRRGNFSSLLALLRGRRRRQWRRSVCTGPTYTSVSPPLLRVLLNFFATLVNSPWYGTMLIEAAG